MNWDRIEGNWQQFKGTAKQQWGKLTDNQLERIATRAARVELLQALGHPADVMHDNVGAGLGALAGADDQVLLDKRGGNRIVGRVHRGSFLFRRGAHFTRCSPRRW